MLKREILLKRAQDDAGRDEQQLALLQTVIDEQDTVIEECETEMETEKANLTAQFKVNHFYPELHLHSL